MSKQLPISFVCFSLVVITKYIMSVYRARSNNFERLSFCIFKKTLMYTEKITKKTRCVEIFNNNESKNFFFSHFLVPRTFLYVFYIAKNLNETFLCSYYYYYCFYFFFF